MYLRAVLKQAVWRFGGVNVLACVGTGLRTLHTPYAPGRACEQGPGRFGHVDVGGAGGLGGPAGRVQSVTAMADSSRRMVGMRTLTSVISTVRRSGSGTGRRGHRAGVLGYVRASAGRVGESMRERVLGLLRERVPCACVSLVSLGFSPYGVASFVHARLGSI